MLARGHLSCAELIGGQLVVDRSHMVAEFAGHGRLSANRTGGEEVFRVYGKLRSNLRNRGRELRKGAGPPRNLPQGPWPHTAARAPYGREKVLNPPELEGMKVIDRAGPHVASRLASSPCPC